ncbi:diguanylate cyclase [Lentzea aerocolonigenes]|uniref:diguanylate cyclase n=1 Tax=Lentzea aerocolonigenes TaxID=68170 RepID=UPI0004C3E2B0|nr:diguanylate cyclase [Lentzea aerocolonigenes]MCP2247511.1 diguanylate cyclase (GGDEF) domain-containing protein [Lentzea aerocolonigenes]
MTSTSTVLVADDSLVIRAVVRAGLEDAGYAVIEADDGHAAIDRCRACSPDVILLDIEMPGMDGHEVLAALKGDETSRDVPVVFLTGRTGVDDVVSGLHGGAHDYLRKPFETPELLARVNAAVHVKKLQDQLRRRNAELERLSRTDLLTGLFNRRHMEEELTRWHSSAVQQGDPMALALFDIDHFKAINDTYGHAVGDLVLREFSRHLTEGLRKGDVACRWGGEEFLVLLPRTPLAGASELAERVRSFVATTPIVVGGHRITVTVSGGCALGPGAGIDAVLSQADQRLYEAKHLGRNRIVASTTTGRRST